MKLRIVSGALRGRVIRGPEKDLAFRPTLERTRQSIADMIMPDLPGCVAADLCAGSGAFGFEMISRGAASVDFIEKDRSRSSLIRKHAARFGVLDCCRFIVEDAASFVQSCGGGRYDIIFFDPPYENRAVVGLVPALIRLLTPRGVLLFQRRRKDGMRTIDKTDTLAPDEIRTFGETVVECYRPHGDLPA